uniref:Uncharacterized protein n=1 Tax=Anguilla anguilla TaxID=7936 RepID=A0A0E9RJV0_ANGAN
MKVGFNCRFGNLLTPGCSRLLQFSRCDR